MNVDEMLQALNGEQVGCLLIGGMNFLLRHVPELTFDVDIWVEDTVANLERLNRALRRLEAEWGRTEAEWKPVPDDWRWLQRQGLFSLTTQHGALDVFRDVRGLEGRYAECRTRAVPSVTGTGVAFLALSDEDMLACQEALPPGERNERRIAVLRDAIYRAKLRPS
ncbi:MAG: hypothetical protein ACYDH9_12230 [Limisphaerales bacterium]